jgi:hypothetical protein
VNPDELKRLYSRGVQTGTDLEATIFDSPEIEGYDVRDRIGRGGMGAVYLADHPALDRQVAVKVLISDPDAPEAERLYREGKALARLEHPHIVAIHDVRTDQLDRPCLILEYLPGGDLSARICESGLEVPEALNLFRQIVSAVAHAHQHGILHRDLKPANILFDKGEKVKVGDFGLASFTHDAPETVLTLSGTTAGTEAYMSPEQKEGKECGPQSDVFSLGVLLHELLTGRRPHGVFDALPSPKMDRVVRRCLRSNPEDRYADATELSQALESTKRKSRHWGIFVGGFVLVAAASFWIRRMQPVPEEMDPEPSVTASPVRSNPTAIPFPEPTEVSPTESVDLLAMVERNLPSLRQVGRWDWQSGELWSRDATVSAWLALPFDPGVSYDLEVHMTRLSGKDTVPIFFPTSVGTASFEVDGWEIGLAGIQNINGQDFRENETSYSAGLRNGEQTEILIQVRSDQVTVRRNGRLEVSLPLAGRTLSPPSIWEYPADAGLGVGSWRGEARFHRIRWQNVPFQ